MDWHGVKHIEKISERMRRLFRKRCALYNSWSARLQTVDSAKFGDATVNVTRFAVNAAGKPVASGTVTSEKRGQVGTFSNAEVTVVPAAEGCTILTLNIGPIDLILLGLCARLYGATENDPVTITITGETGPGKLLGNLLCGIAGLLDGQTPVNRLNIIVVILNRILRLPCLCAL